MFYVSEIQMNLMLIISVSLEALIIFYRRRKSFSQICAKGMRISSKYSINTLHSKKLFQHITRVALSTLDHVLRISRTCCNYFSSSLDPGEYNGYNYSITRRPNNIWSHEEDIFPILSKSNVENSYMFEDPSKLYASEK